MKRTTIGTATIVCVLFILVSKVTLAQQSTNSQDAGSNLSDKKGPWLEFADGVRVAKVAKPADGQPEFAILHLNDATYHEFQKDPKAFVNKYQIFDKKVNVLPNCSMVPATPQQGGDADWYVMMPHWPASNARCMTLLGGTEPSDQVGSAD
jgi:hypothetical protein